MLVYKKKQSNPGEPLNIHDSIQSLPLNILGILKNKFLNGKYGFVIYFLNLSSI